MSLERLQEHREIWRSKPALRAVYEPWFELLVAPLPRGARVLELGAGPGLLSEWARGRRPDVAWVASDLIPAPWNAVAADAGHLPFRSQSFDAVLGLDVLHHLDGPRPFFGEASRVLAPGGHLALVEPWVTVFSFPIYRWLHQEDCRLRIDPWDPFASAPGGKDAFDGNAAIPWRLLRDATADDWGRLGFERPSLSLVNALAYIPTLGFRRRQLVPTEAMPWLQRLDRALGPLARWFALRAHLVWRRRA